MLIFPLSSSPISIPWWRRSRVAIVGVLFVAGALFVGAVPQGEGQATGQTPSVSAAAPSEASPGMSVDLPSEWKGNSGVVVSVVDEHGAPLPDAEVALSKEEGGQRLVARTDATGRITLEGLAAGEWQVDIRREGFMLFNAYVLLQEGKKPKVAFSSRQRTGSYWAPMQAVFLPPGVRLTPGVASGRESVRQAQAKADRATKDARREERRSARASDRGRLARVVPSEPTQSTSEETAEGLAKVTVEGLVEAPEVADVEPEGDRVSPGEAVSDPAVVVAEALSREEAPDARSDARSIESPVDARPADASAEEDVSEEPDVEETTETQFKKKTEPVGLEPELPVRETQPAAKPATLPAVEPTAESTAELHPSSRAEPPEAPERSEQFVEVERDVGTSRPRASKEQAEASVPQAQPQPEFEVRSPTPRLLRNPNLLPAGACPECGPGEFSVAARGQAKKFERGNTCSSVGAGLVEDLSARINGALVDKLSTFAGSLAESNGNDVLRLLPPTLKAEIVEALGVQDGSCQVLGVVLPAGAKYVGFRYQAGERSVMAECPGGGAPSGLQDCQLKDAHWLSVPKVIKTLGVTKTPGVTLVLGVFENRSRRSTRLPRLVVYFQPARGWLPPS